MTEWTPAALAELKQYLEDARQSLADSGADPTEVIDDLRRHFDEEAELAQLPVVTEQDIRRWIVKLGPTAGLPGASRNVPPPPLTTTQDRSGPGAATIAPSPWLLVFGVVLPLVTLLFEVATGFCASVFFDPLPTSWHVFIVALVPAINLAAWISLMKSDGRRLAMLGWLNGVAIVIASYYSILYLPLLLPGIFAMLFAIGLLPLTPILCLVGTVGLRRHLRDRAQAFPGLAFPGAIKVMALGLTLLLVVDGRMWITRWSMAKAISEEATDQRVALRWLRLLGDHTTLLRACYGRTRTAAEFDLGGQIFGVSEMPVEDARRIYYRVTGQPFNSVPPPPVRTARGQALDFSQWTWDEEQGGEQVGGRLAGLTLADSRMDALVDPDAAVAYLEWILEFRNSALQAQEARAQIQLPPGGVVSRLSLWVNGEEREAAFSSRAHVRSAYQQIAMIQRRDPVLVTMSGPDRILMQCFPVPADGGTIKVRVGITSPLSLRKPDEGVMSWPLFVERNFSIPASRQHAIWVESRGEFVVPGPEWACDNSQPGRHGLRGRVTEDTLRETPGAVRVRRSTELQQVWAGLERDGKMVRVVQKTRFAQTGTNAPLTVVVDGSRGMDRYLPVMTEALSGFAESGSLVVLHAGDDTEVIDTSSAEHLRRGLHRSPYHGGLDNVETLAQAWEVAANGRGGAVLWLHLPKPVIYDSMWPLEQALQRRPQGPRIHSFSFETGPNRLLEALQRVTAVEEVARIGSTGADLGHWLGVWQGKETVGLFDRQCLGVNDSLPDCPQGSSHVVRLWAFDQVKKLVAGGKIEEAVALACKFQLVTSVSGAVVLETKEQYQVTGLTPVEPESVPSALSVPDGGATWLLLVGGCIMIFGFALLSARRRVAHP